MTILTPSTSSLTSSTSPSKKVGQTSNNVIPRSIYILTLSTVGLDAALVSSSASLPGGSGGNNLNFSSIYSSRGGTGGKFETRRENRPVHDGLRRLYEFGYFGRSLFLYLRC